MLPKEKLERLDTDRKVNFVAMAAAFFSTSAIGIAALAFWLTAGPAIQVEASVPGMDGKPDNLLANDTAADLAGVFQDFDAEPSSLPGAWPQFRGVGSENIVEDAPPLDASWGADGPKIAWSVDLGEGYAAPVVFDGSAYILDYDEEAKADALRCINLETGEEIWRRSYEIDIKRNHGMSRTIPAVTKDYIVTMGPRCHVVCLDTPTGEYRWGYDLQREYGTEQPLWYTGQCPIIEDGVAVVAPCGTDMLMMGIDCDTGEVVWSAPNERGWEMSHSSVIPMTILGKPMYVYCAIGGVAGVSAAEEDRGQLLWQYNWDAKMVAPSPVKAGDDLIFMCGSYNKGAIMLRIKESGGAFESELVYEHDPKGGLASEQQTPIFYNGYLYGIQKKEAGSLKGQFACYDVDGNLVWSSGADHRFGLGPFLVADNKFFVLNDEGVLTVLDATKQEYAPLAQYEVLDGHDAWGPIALAGTRMIVRDLDNMVCLDLSTD